MCVTLAGCVSRADPPRYFRPPLPERAPAEKPLGRRLALARVEAASHLDVRIVWRRSDVELGFYDVERWTDPPASYLERAVSEELYARRGLRRVEGEGPELQVKLLAFEEVLLPQHRARVEVWARLLDDRREARLERAFASELPVAAEEADAMARALGQALDQVVVALADAVIAALPPEPPAEPPEAPPPGEQR
ncbi:MAG: ABC-type transport auxiliary lipoprotein family protein [Planctomycetota bacterium]